MALVLRFSSAIEFKYNPDVCVYWMIQLHLIMNVHCDKIIYLYSMHWLQTRLISTLFM